jgi:hypothetical protein
MSAPMGQLPRWVDSRPDPGPQPRRRLPGVRPGGGADRGKPDRRRPDSASGALGYGEGSASPSTTPPTSSSPALRWRSPFTPAVQHRRRGPGLCRRPRRGASPAWRSITTCPGGSPCPSPLAGAAFGRRLGASMPGYLQAKRGSHVVITTIMFNFIAAALMTYMLVNVLRQPGSMAPESRTFEDGGRLPRSTDVPGSACFGYSPVNMSLFIALIGLRPGLAADLAHPAGLRDPHLRRKTPPRPSMPAFPRSDHDHHADLRRLAGMMAINEIMGVACTG